MVRIVSNNPERGSNKFTKRTSRGAFRSKFPLLARRAVRTLGKVDPSNAQGVGFPRVANLIPATLTTAMAGANNDLTFTAKQLGLAGNAIRVAFVNPGGTVGRSVVVAGNDITVNLAVTAGVINATETGASIRDTLNTHATASGMITAALATGNDGTGVVAAFALTNLAGGADQFSENGVVGASGVSKGVAVMGTQAQRTGPVGGAGSGVRIRNRGKNTTLKKR